MLVWCLSGGLESFHRSQPHWPFCSERCVQRTGAWPPSWRSALTSPSPGRRWTHHCEMCTQQSVSRSIPPCPNILQQTRDWRAMESKAYVKMNSAFGVSHSETLVTSPWREALHSRWFGSLCPQPSKLAWLSLTQGSVCPRPAQNEKKDWDIWKTISPTPTEHNRGHKMWGWRWRNGVEGLVMIV